MGSRVEQYKPAIKAALKVGIKQYISSYEPEHSIAIVTKEHGLTVHLLGKSGLAYTFCLNLGRSTRGNFSHSSSSKKYFILDKFRIYPDLFFYTKISKKKVKNESY
ncbi:hypothetical protein COW36_03025 [bacterium (Candidatus Blackallbacteria) CG17_big_fil_post_rev_8_21_14_2_50_48_46]|uniref:Uncharacterized protein n=1 Tax=bacterium (Candidatus Blackallbacteria) CG17_big_fil_post_rev_8_21_14_2_50_48_46 TaxID=2014261 RepID=A0A2M7GAD2_9BACT|nr:MAG: hypothetical protein COW36_03025 [bacterium (Candidatus Blackallbacteria) CG17_big_fil_post_rev_8_21_14_2_50_48_46]